MTTIQFKTNINCGSCIKSVTPHLNALENIESWEVDTDVSDKTLSVTTEENTAQVENEVLKALQQAGFKAEVSRS